MPNRGCLPLWRLLISALAIWVRRTGAPVNRKNYFCLSLPDCLSIEDKGKRENQQAAEDYDPDAPAKKAGEGIVSLGLRHTLRFHL